MRRWKIIARHHWVGGCTLTESINLVDDNIRRYTATIRGWRNFRLYEGKPYPGLSEELVIRMKEIREAIDNGSLQVFYVRIKETNNA